MCACASGVMVVYCCYWFTGVRYAVMQVCELGIGKLQYIAVARFQCMLDVQALYIAVSVPLRLSFPTMLPVHMAFFDLAVDALTPVHI